MEINKQSLRRIQDKIKKQIKIKDKTLKIFQLKKIIKIIIEVKLLLIVEEMH